LFIKLFCYAVSGAEFELQIHTS